MGRMNKPTELLDATGAFLSNPSRRRPNEPKSDRPLGAPPKYLGKEHKKIWKEVAARALPGVLKESDGDAFEILVRLTYKVRTNFDGMMAAQVAQLINLYARFAMTPADRSKVSVEAPKESTLNKFLKKTQRPTPVNESEVSVPPELAN